MPGYDNLYISNSGYTKEETVRLGRGIHEPKIRAEVEPEHNGLFFVVDVIASSYKVDNSDLAAFDRALSMNPDAMLYFTAPFASPAKHRCSSSPGFSEQ